MKSSREPQVYKCKHSKCYPGLLVYKCKLDRLIDFYKCKQMIRRMNEHFLKKTLMALIAYFASISTMIYIVLIFVLIDFLTGMYASYRTKTPIISSKLRRTIEKLVFYTVSIMIAHMFQHHFMNWFNLTQIVAGFIAATELLSIYENIRKVTKLDVFKRIIDTIKEQFFKKQ